VDTLRGHVNNVSCVIFHPKQDLIVSDSEDKSLRVWDMSKRVGVQTFRREHDRFWILTAHPAVNLLAAGHDSGMIVFKLERERPAYAAHGTTVYYIKDRYLRAYDTATQRDAPLVAIRRNPAALYNQGPRTLAYNPAEHAVLVQTDVEGGSYELYAVPKDAAGRDVAAEAKRGFGAAAVFIARNRFAVLDRAANTIVVKDLRNEVTKKVPSPLPTTEAIFYAGTGALLVRSEDRVALLDVQQRSVLAELPTPPIKYVVWSGDMERVALLSKHAIVVADKRLGGAVTVHETIRIKSAAWDDAGVLVYTTLNHIKYCLPNGAHGVVRTLDTPVYLTRVHDGTVHCLDREAKPRAIRINTSEFTFKAALAERRYDAVLAMIRAGALCGQAIIAYLQEKGYPEVALHFVRDERIRFALAVECGNIEVALASAQELDDADTWHALGVEALRQGNHQIVEFSYQKTKNYERLSFLYLITGNLDKLAKMQKIAGMRGDVMSTFHNALFLGDVRERVKVLAESGQTSLAYVTAATHGLAEEAEALGAELGAAAPALPPGGGRLLLPPAPIMRESNWPLLTVSKGFFETLATKDAERAKAGAAGAAAAAAALEQVDLSAAGGAWGDDDDEDGGMGLGLGLGEGGGGGGGGGPRDLAGGGDSDDEGDGDGGWEMEDLELPAEALAEAAPAAGGGEMFVAPTPGVSPSNRWATKCSLAAEQAAAGAFDTAMRLLTRQLGIVEFAPLRPYFLEVHQAAAAALPMLPTLPASPLALDRDWDPDAARQEPAAPALPFSLAQLEEQLKRAYRLVTEGKFADALRGFNAILHVIPLLVVPSRKEVDEVRELLGIARDYNIALRVELKRREAKDDAPRAAELAAYFTHCSLQRVHLALSLRAAMTAFFKLRNFNTCATFARRLLELQPDEKMAAQARQVLAACEKSPVDEAPVDYDPRNPFDLCSITFSPIYRGNKFVEDPYTKARFQPQCAGQISPVGGLSRIGADASGLVASTQQGR
jgi:coatomer protein complex subunit alpha (xenin)